MLPKFRNLRPGERSFFVQTVARQFRALPRMFNRSVPRDVVCLTRPGFLHQSREETFERTTGFRTRALYHPLSSLLLTVLILFMRGNKAREGAYSRLRT